MHFPSMPDKLRRLRRSSLTFMAVPSSNGRVRSFSVSLPAACVCAGLATGLVLAFCVIYVRLGITAVTSYQARLHSEMLVENLSKDNAKLKEKAEEQKDQLKMMSQKIQLLESKIVALDNLGTEIRSIISGRALKGSSQVPSRGTSRDSIDRTRATPAESDGAVVEASQGPDVSVDELDTSLDELLRRASAVSQELTNLKAQAKSYRDRLDRTPDLWPVRGRLSSGFGRRLHPITRRMHFHSGVDIVARMGTAVHATASGVVVYAGWRSGYGWCVELNHGYGLSTLYAHLSKFDVKRGDRVGKGQVIAYSGNSGTSTGPHVHYEVRRHGSPVNPWNYVK